MQSLVAFSHPDRNFNSPIDYPADGGQVEDILKRLGNVEADVSELKSNVSTILATIPHLATKADVKDLRAEMAAQFGSLRAEMADQLGSVRADMSAQIGSLRADMSGQIGSLRADMSGQIGSLRAEMSARETAFIKWMIATVLAASGLAFTIAKFVH